MLPLAILAGGYAKRLGPLTKEFPKCLVEVNGRPFVDWQLDLLISNGYSNFIFCVSHKSELIQEYLGDGSSRGINIEYSHDGETQLGTGGAIKNALPKLGDTFGVIYGDSYLPTNYSKIEQRFLFSKSIALMTVYENNNEFDSSNVEFVDGTLIEYRKGIRSERFRHIDYGLTFFRSESFSSWADRSFFDLSEVCNKLSKSGEIEGFEVFDRFYEVGSIVGIANFSHYLRMAKL